MAASTIICWFKTVKDLYNSPTSLYSQCMCIQMRESHNSIGQNNTIQRTRDAYGIIIPMTCHMGAYWCEQCSERYTFLLIQFTWGAENVSVLLQEMHNYIASCPSKGLSWKQICRAIQQFQPISWPCGCLLRWGRNYRTPALCSANTVIIGYAFPEYTFHIKFIKAGQDITSIITPFFLLEHLKVLYSKWKGHGNSLENMKCCL